MWNPANSKSRSFTDKLLFLQPATTQDLFGYWIIQAPYSNILRYKGLIAYLTNAWNKSYRKRLIVGRAYELNPDSMLGIVISNHNYSGYFEKKPLDPIVCISLLP